MSVPPQACCVSVCLLVCLRDPASETTVLLFPKVVRAHLVRISLFLAVLLGLLRDPAAEAPGLRHSKCPSVSLPYNSHGFQGVLKCFSGQSSPNKLIKSPQDTNGCIQGHTLLYVSSVACSLMHSYHHAKMFSLPAQAILIISIIRFFSPDLFPPGTRQGAFYTTLSPSCTCPCFKLWFNWSHIAG